MSTEVDWPAEFAKVIACQAFSRKSDRNLLSDADENVRRPVNYWWRRRALACRDARIAASRANLSSDD
jgi:hypothetical protein